MNATVATGTTENTECPTGTVNEWDASTE